MLAAAIRLATFVEMRFKQALACRRPNEYSPQVQPMIQTPAHGTLPMGHATETFIAAFVLWKLLSAPQPGTGVAMPPYADLSWGLQLFRLASRVAMNRIVAGLHFTVDAAAGEVLGFDPRPVFCHLLRCRADLQCLEFRWDGNSRIRLWHRLRQTTAISTGPNFFDFAVVPPVQTPAPAPAPPYATMPAGPFNANPEPSPWMAMGSSAGRVDMTETTSDTSSKGGDHIAKQEDFASVPGVDPFVDWALGPGRKYFFLPGRSNQDRMPVVVKLNGIKVKDFATGAQFDKESNRSELVALWAKSVQVSMLETEGPGAAELNSYCAPTVTETFFHLLKQQASLRELVAGVTLGLPLDSELLPPPHVHGGIQP